MARNLHRGIASAALAASMIMAAVLIGPSGAWAQETKLTADDAEELSWFGNSVSIDGDTAIVGAPRDGETGVNSGAAYVFVLSGGIWTEQAKLTASDPLAGKFFGDSVAISGDTAVVGATTGAPGSAYVFVRSGATWTEQQKLTPDDVFQTDFFGCSVSVSGDTLVVGAYAGRDEGIITGLSYVYLRSGATWTLQARLVADDASNGDVFGQSVSISGDTLVVGANGDNDGGTNSGSAYVFTRAGTSWTQQAKLTADDAAEGDNFGASVSLDGSTAVVGAFGDDDGGANSGSAYVFTRSGTSWAQQAKLTADDAASNDTFGLSVSISGNTAVVGAHRDNDGGSDSGSAYVFARSGTSWTQRTKLTASDAAAGDYFGWSVSLSGARAIVGAYRDDDAGTDSGSAYVYVIGNSVTFETDGTPGATLTGDVDQNVAQGEDAATVTANSPASHTFVKWTRDSADFSFDSSLTVTNVTEDMDLVAEYAINEYALTYNAGAGGSITGTNPQTVDYGTSGDAVTAVPDSGFTFIEWSDTSMDNPRTDTNVTANITVTAIFADITAPTSAASVSDATQVGGDITGTFTAADLGSGISSIALYVKEPGGAWTNTGPVAGASWNYTPTQTGDPADGLYEFTTVATDNASNSETAPSGSDAGHVAVIYNDLENSNFAYAAITDGAFTFPMTPDLDMIITFSGGASGGPITVSRTTGDVAEGGFNADALIDESLSITGNFTGSAIITWNFDPASDDGLTDALDTVFQFQGGSLVNQYPVTPAGETLTIGPVTQFSDWYAGNNNATTVNEWLLLDE